MTTATAQRGEQSMQTTSLEAYKSLTSAKLNERQKQVLEALEEIAPATNRMISEHSGIPINVVTPRMGELAGKGKIEQAYVGVDVSGRKAIYWRPVRKLEQVRLFDETH